MNKDELIEYIKNNVDKLTIKEIAKNTNTTEGRISSLMSRNKIYRTKKLELELLDGEEFRDLDCLKGVYKVSNYGRVININNKIMNDFDCKGYRRITLSPIKGKKEKFFVHRLVAMAFIDKPENKDYINHKDSNPRNNHVSNLEWVTPSENEKHKMNSKNSKAIKYNLSEVNKLNSPYRKQKEQLVRNICIDIKDGELTISNIAKKYNVTSNYVSSIKNKRSWVSISKEYF